MSRHEPPQSQGHVPDDLLAAFVGGDVEERVAVHIAEHIDRCPMCATRAATSEPLAAAFATVPDPVVPADLVASILEEAERPEPLPLVEVAIGLGLLLLAVFLMGMGEDPVRFAVDSLRVFQALVRGATAVGATTALAWGGGAMFIGGVVLLAMRTEKSELLQRLERRLG